MLGIMDVTLTSNASPDRLSALCRDFGVRSLAVFGSIARGEERSDSDVDLLVEFEPGRRVGLFTLARLEGELTELFGRKVDLRTPGDLSRYFRANVVEGARPLYASR
jgi:predicted nucleotidyltransferase